MVQIAGGGTGLTTTPAPGALDIGNGTGFTRTTLTAGTNIAITNGSGSISIATSATPSFSTSVTTPLVIGGTTASSSLTLQSTSGVGTTDSIIFKVGNNGATTAMTVDTSGNVLVGTTSAFVSGSGTKVQNLSTYGSRNSGAASGKYWTFGGDSGNSFTLFNQTPTGVYVADGGTSWNAFSDERLKTDLVPITDAVSKVSTLRAVTGRLKTDEEGISRVFLIAQDVQAVLPEAVHVGEDENKTLGLAYTEVIPLLVAAIKEQQTQIEELKARLAKLETAQ